MEIQVKIPLTLGIIDGINVEVGRTRFTIPVAGIRETFWMNDDDLIVDPEGRELLLVRGESYSLIRLHSLFNLPARAESIQQGILIMVENERHNIMIFADSLLGQQQVVIKPIPEILQKRMGRTKALAGCAMLGDGSISLVLDVSSLGSSNSLETQPLQAS